MTYEIHLHVLRRVSQSKSERPALGTQSLQKKSHRQPLTRPFELQKEYQPEGKGRATIFTSPKSCIYFGSFQFQDVTLCTNEYCLDSSLFPDDLSVSLPHTSVF